MNTKRSVHPLTKSSFLVRLLYHSFGFVVYLIIYFEEKRILLLILAGVMISWPFLAYFFSSRSKHVKTAEKRNLLVEAFFLGILVTQLSFAPLPTVLLFGGRITSDLHLGGIKLAVKGLFVMFLGIFIMVIFNGFSFQYETYPIIEYLTVCGATFYFVALGAVIRLTGKKLSNSRKVIQDQNVKIEVYSKALRQELIKGQKIQKEFLPHKIPSFEGYEIQNFLHPALQLSGDFYDFFILPNDRLGIVIADISDKGVGSALFMALIRSLIRVFSGHFDYSNSTDSQNQNNSNRNDLDNVRNTVSMTNNYLSIEHGEEGMFATLFFGILDPKSGVLSYTNCGHEPLMLIGENKTKGTLNPLGPALGIESDLNYKSNEIALENGDILFGFTDGVTEARSPSGGLYTKKRLKESVERAQTDSAELFLESIKNDLFSYIGTAPQADDITMFAVKKL